MCFVFVFEIYFLIVKFFGQAKDGNFFHYIKSRGGKKEKEKDRKRRLTEAVSSLIAIYEAHGFALELPCLIGLRGKVEKYKREINECLDEI